MVLAPDPVKGAPVSRPGRARPGARLRQQSRHRLGQRLGAGVQHQFWRCGSLVGRAEPVNSGISPARRLGVEPLHVARLADLERRVDVHLDEAPGADDRPRAYAFGLRKGEMSETIAIRPASVQQPRRFGGAADVFGAVLAAEAEVTVQPGAQGVAVEHEGVAALAWRRPLQLARDRRLADPDSPVSHTVTRAGPSGAPRSASATAEVSRTTSRSRPRLDATAGGGAIDDHPGGGGRLRGRVDRDEAGGRRVRA